VVDEPTVDIDCAFLLGAITMMGISAANKFFTENTIIIIKIINFVNNDI